MRLVIREGQLIVSDEQATQVESQGQRDYESTTNYVEEHIFRNKSAFSMVVLHSLYERRINDSHYRQK